MTEETPKPPSLAEQKPWMAKGGILAILIGWAAVIVYALGWGDSWRAGNLAREGVDVEAVVLDTRIDSRFSTEDGSEYRVVIDYRFDLEDGGWHRAEREGMWRSARPVPPEDGSTFPVRYWPVEPSIHEYEEFIGGHARRSLVKKVAAGALAALALWFAVRATVRVRAMRRGA